MAFVPFTNVVQIEARYTQDGQQVENVYHCDVGAPPDEAVMTALATAFIEDWWNTARSFAADSLTLVAVVVRDLTTATGLAVEIGVVGDGSGTGTSAALPNNATVAIKWTTGFSGRSFRGRTFHLGLQIADVDGSTVQPGSIAALSGSYAALKTALFDAGGTMCVASRISGGVDRVAGVCTTITSLTIEPTVDSQRRRLPGRGS